MNVDAIQQLLIRRETDQLTDVEYLIASRQVIENLKTKSSEEEQEKKAMLATIDSLQERATYWQKKECDFIGGQVEDWLAEKPAAAH
jgi:hypothetical protein